MSNLNMALPEDKNLPAVTLLQPTEVAPVVLASGLVKSAQDLQFRPLTGDDLALVKKWARELIPADPNEPPDYINIDAAELNQLTGASRSMLTNLSVEEMQKVRAVAGLVLAKVQSVDVSKLSPKARAKLLGFKETLKDIVRRIDAFFNRYRTVQGELDKVVKQIVEMRDHHIELKNQADQIGKETKGSRNVLRVSVEACKLFLKDTGYPVRDQLIQAVDADLAASKEKSQLPDESLSEKLAAWKNYLVIVEGYMATMEGAVIDATQAFMGLEMLEQNERIIAQTLNNLIVFTIPAWQRMIAIAYIASMGEQTAEFVAKQNDVTNQMRKQTADLLKMSAAAIAKLIVTNSFDDDSLEYMTVALVEALDLITTASVEAEKLHDISRQKGYKMVERVNAARVKYGKSGKNA